MSEMDDLKVPPELQAMFRSRFLETLQHDPGLDHDEFPLFKWFAKETDALIDSMLAVETAGIKEQVDAGIEDFNDSGFVAVEYFARRTRYSHVIFLTSVFESYLDRACTTLRHVVGKHNMPFTLEELSGDKWTKRRRFLERYGHFQINDSEWETAEILSTVRNILVHDNGSTSSISEKIMARLRSLDGLRLDSHEIVVESVYVRGAASGLRKLIDSIQSEIKKVASLAQRPQGVIGSGTP